MEQIKSSRENLREQTLEERALAFIKQMKQVLPTDEDGKNKFDNFFFGMEDYKFRRISFEDLMAVVEDTFEGHEILVSGFKKFLFNGQETDQVSSITCKNKNKNSNGNHGYELKDEACVKYLKKVKDRFEKNSGVYDAFLKVLEEYETGENNVVEVYENIWELFIGHFDLLEEFDYFFTDMDKKTRRKIAEIKTIVIERRLSKLEKLVTEGIHYLKLSSRVLECSDSISKGEFTRDIELYFSNDDLKSLRILHGGKSKHLKKEFRKRPRKLFGDIINDRLKMEITTRLLAWKKLIFQQLHHNQDAHDPTILTRIYYMHSTTQMCLGNHLTLKINTMELYYHKLANISHLHHLKINSMQKLKGL